MLSCKCNWHCQYCAVNNSHDRKNELLDSQIIANANLVTPNSIVTLFGGEPGLASRHLIEHCLDILSGKKCDIYLETNGTFLERYPDLVWRFKEILYHCSEDLDINQKMVDCSDYKNIRYLLIVHDKNIDLLSRFLVSYPEIKFDIIEATYPYPEEMSGPTLTVENKKYVLTNFGHRMTRESFHRFIHGKDFEPIEFLDDR